ncbi:MAG: HYR domain-containing protein, partial [Bacteroidetes bacterium]|nr:HYR domain-containing protein [Bacteroidota bacterium]
MKASTVGQFVILLFVLFCVYPVLGQNTNTSIQEPGRKYPPTTPVESFVLPGSNNDAPAGSISVAEDPVYNNYSPAQLVQNVLVTGCLSASNVRFGYYTQRRNHWYWNNHNWSSTAGNRQMAYFNKATSTFPLDEGIILSTGKSSSAMGPNNTGSYSNQMLSQASDPDLTSVSGKTMHDASVLEFDFIPAANTLQFTYVFASEEYTEYCETQFNDAFGFFLSGPGITGPYTHNAVNLAVIPNNIPVSINTIHPAGVNVNNQSFPAENAQYYHDNPAGSLTMQYDGSTVVLTATYSVIPCATYKIKMCVADASDQKWDAAVFLGARSFNSENVNLTNFGNFIQGQNNVFEGCNNFLRVSRNSDDLSQPAVVNLLLSGTATNGVDIQTNGNQPFPATVTIPANAAYLDIPYIAVNDGIPDNAETFIIKVNTSCPCSANQVFVTTTIHIFEQIVINSISATNVQCNGQNNGTITVNATGGSGNYLYSIDNGTNWQSINNFTGLAAGTYTILVKDPGSCLPNSSATATIGAPTPLNANAGPDVTICTGSSTQLNGTGGVQYSWSPATGLNYTNIANPIASPLVTTTYTLTVSNSSGDCISTDQVTITVNPAPVAPKSISINRQILCNDDNGNIILTAIGGQGTTLRWFEGTCGGNSIGTGNNISIPSPAFTTTYYAWWENNCGHSACAGIAVTVPTAISVSAIAGNISCFGGTTSLTATASGGTGSFQYSINGGIYQSSNVFAVNTLGSPYEVTVKDANNCTSSTGSIIINQPEELSFNSIVIQKVSCPGASNGQIMVQATGGTGVITYSINPSVGTQTPPGTFNSLTSQTYTLTATDANGCLVVTSLFVGTTTDVIAPQIINCSLPQSANTTIGCSASLPDFTGSVIATDNCTLSPNLIVTQSPAAGSIVPTGITVITITVKDEANNTATCTTTFTVSDNQLPTISGPANITVNADPGVCSASNVNLGTPVINDNCGVGSVTNNAPSSFPVGNTNVTWTVSDLGGNTATSTQVVTVIDNQPPTITCPPAVFGSPDPG